MTNDDTIATYNIYVKYDIVCIRIYIEISTIGSYIQDAFSAIIIIVTYDSTDSV